MFVFVVGGIAGIVLWDVGMGLWEMDLSDVTKC